MPTRAASAAACCSASPDEAPASRAGRAMLSPSVSVGSKLKNWNTNPMRVRLIVVRASSPSEARARPSSDSVPDVGRSIAPQRCSSDDLPQPDGPMRATNSPASRVNETPARACTSEVPPV